MDNFYVGAKPRHVSHPPFAGAQTETICVDRTISGKQVHFQLAKRKIRVFVTRFGEFHEIKQLPKQLTAISSKELLLTTLNSSQLRLAPINNGKNYNIYCDAKLLGGDPYSTQFTQLFECIQNLSNPILVNEIFSALESKFKRPLEPDYNIAEGLGFEWGKDWPASVQTQLKLYAKEISDYLKTANREEYDARKEKILHDHKQLQMKMNEQLNDSQWGLSTLWPQFEFLLQIPHIKALEGAVINPYLKEFLSEKPKPSSLEKLIDLFPKKENEREIDKYIAITSNNIYPDLYSLISQTRKSKPKVVKKGILTYWNKGKDYFKGKVLVVKDDHNFHSAAIADIERRGATLSLFLVDLSEVHISKAGWVDVVKKDSYRLLFALMHEIITVGQEFEVSQPGLQEEYIATLPPGRYVLKNKEEKSPNIINKAIGAVTPNIVNKALGSGEHCVEFALHKIRPGDASVKPDTYQLRLYHKAGTSTVEKVTWGRWKKGELIEEYECTASDFAKLQGVIYKKETFSRINQGNLNQQVKILNEDFVDNAKKNQTFKAIEKKLADLKDLLKHDPTLVKALLDDLIDNQLQKVGAIPQSLESDLVGLSDAYCVLELALSPSDILKRIVLETNYELIVTRNQATLIAHTMELFSQAQQQLEQIKGKNLIMMMGFTGSGKSSAVCYFLGGKVEEFYNFGDKCIRLDPSVDAKNFPKIGQSLGTSETLYAQGYQLPVDASPFIVDSPGLNDTRRGGYEICANLSIDQAVVGCASLSSVVVTTPIQLFQTERGNHLIELVDSIEEKFPLIFSEDCEANKRLFLLVTKREQVEEDIWLDLEKRIRRYKNDAQKYCQSLNERAVQNQQISDSERANAMLRERIWTTLLSMYEEGRVVVIDYRDGSERNTLLKQYTSGTINKQHYVPALESTHLQRHFGNYIEEATQIWTLHFFNEYLLEMPKQLANELSGLCSKQKSHQRETSTFDALVEEKKELHSWQLTVNSSAGEVLDTNQFSELLKKINNQALKALEGRISQYTQKATEMLHELDTLKVKERELRKEIELNQGICSERSELIQKHSIDFYVDTLAKFEPKDGDVMALSILKDPITSQIALNEVRDFRAHEIKSIENTTVQDFNNINRGWYHVYLGLGKETRRINHHRLLHRSYRIQPGEDELRTTLERELSADGFTASAGEFTATIRGEKFRHWGCKGTPCGTKMKYVITTEWDGSYPLPHFTIEHRIPNAEYNRAQIANWQAEILSAQNKLNELNKEWEGEDPLPSVPMQRKVTEEKLKTIKTELKAFIKQRRDLTSEVISRYIPSRLQEVEQLIPESEQARKQLEAEMDAHTKKIQELTEKKRRYAVAIWTQKENAKILADFCNLIIKQSAYMRFQPKQSALDQCGKYNRLCIEQFGQLVHASMQDLNLIGAGDDTNYIAEYDKWIAK